MVRLGWIVRPPSRPMVAPQADISRSPGEPWRLGPGGRTVVARTIPSFPGPGRTRRGATMRKSAWVLVLGPSLIAGCSGGEPAGPPPTIDPLPSQAKPAGTVDERL